MPGPKKVDWKPIRDAFVLEGKSARELARQFGLSNSTVSAKARTEDWEGQKIAYQNSVARRSYERVADSVAHEQSEIRKESVLAARLYLRKFIADVNAGNVHTNAKDAATMVQLLVRELSPEKVSEVNDTPTILEVSGQSDTDFLRRVLEMARKRVDPAGSVGPGLLVDPPPPRPN